MTKTTETNGHTLKIIRYLERGIQHRMGRIYNYHLATVIFSFMLGALASRDTSLSLVMVLVLVLVLLGVIATGIFLIRAAREAQRASVYDVLLHIDKIIEAAKKDGLIEETSDAEPLS